MKTSATLMHQQSLGVTQWLSRRPKASVWAYGAPVEIRSSGPGHGLGLFATRSVAQFSAVLADKPLILLKPSDDLPELYQHFKRLGEEDQHLYLNLSYHDNPARDALLKDKLLQRGFGQDGLEEMAQVAGIMQTNAFNVDMGDGQGACHRALFPLIARINHSCAPNANVCFHYLDGASSGRMTVYALKDLQAGEEVMISYFNITLPQLKRQEKARKWGFECQCLICHGDSSTGKAEGDRQTIRIFVSDQERVMRKSRVTIKELNALVERAQSIASHVLIRPEMYPILPDLFDRIGMLQAKVLVIQKCEGQREGVISVLETAASWEARITGRSSPATMKRLVKVANFAGARIPPSIKQDSHDFAVEWTSDD